MWFQIPSIGIYGAIIGSIVNNIVACALSFIVLMKTIKLDISCIKYIFKPIIATIIMGICSYFTYLLIGSIIPKTVATIIAMGVAVAIYAFAVIALRILSKEEIKMIPYGIKMVNVLEKLGVY